MEELTSGFKSFDLRFLALDKLRSKADGSSFITYSEARCILGRLLHLPKNESRLLLLGMSKMGLIKFSKEKIIFQKHNKHSR